LNWQPVERALQAMYPATTGRPPCAPLVLFKMSLLQHYYGLSDPQCEEMVGDRMSWRRFAGLGLQDKVPDETTLVRFRQRLMEQGLHEKLLTLVNRQLEQKGFILKTCTLVDATLLAAARRAPAKEDQSGGDEDAGFTVKKGRPHYGYKAHVAADQTHTLIRQVTLTEASVHDSQEFESLVTGDEAMVMADKAYWSRKRSQWCERRNIGNGILRKAFRGQPLDKTTLLFNRLMSRVRCGIEKIFGWWKRCAGYWQVRYVGREPNRLELEFKSICWNLKRLATLTRA
jgi:IS5 family transposase